MLGRYNVAKRHVSFFVTTNRVTNYAKKENQTNASVELLEKNYLDLKEYYNTDFQKVNKNLKDYPVINDRTQKPKQFVDDALSSISTQCVTQNEPKPTILTKPDSNIPELQLQKTIENVNNGSIRSIYDTLKRSRTSSKDVLSHLEPKLVTTLVERLINFNQKLKKNSLYLTTNQSKISFESRPVHDTTKAVFQQTKKILNRLDIDHLSLHDCEKLVKFYYEEKQYTKAIEMISEIEERSKTNENFYLTNSLWMVKLDILSKTYVSSWNIYGLTMNKIGKSQLSQTSFQYPHHSDSFELVVRRYYADKERLNLQDSVAVINTIIRGLGKNGDLPSLNRLLEMTWGIKVDNSEKGIYLMDHFSLKNVSLNLWPTEDTLISILLAYSKNGAAAKAIKINNMLLEKYQHNNTLNPVNTRLYWETALRVVGHFGDAVSKQTAAQLADESLIDPSGNSLLDIRYRLFDTVADMSTYYLKAPTRKIIDMKMKYSSVDKLLEDLPLVFKTLINPNYNTSELNREANDATLKKYVSVCCKELANRHLFRDANKVVDNFSPSKSFTVELKNTLKDLQEQYARDTVKDEERKRKAAYDDDDYGLW